MGVVYVLANPMMPGCVKIGSTCGNPQLRAAELSSPTGVPAPFKVVLYAETDDWRGYEAEIHDMLSPWRLPRREFFTVWEGSGNFEHVIDAFGSCFGEDVQVVDREFYARNQWRVPA